MTTCFRVTAGLEVFSELVFVKAQTATRLSSVPKKSRALKKNSVPFASWLYWLALGDVAGWMLYQAFPVSCGGTETVPPTLMWTTGPGVFASNPDLDVA